MPRVTPHFPSALLILSAWVCAVASGMAMNHSGGLTTNLTRYTANDGANALRLHSIEHRKADNTVWQSHSYNYDLAGNITTWAQTQRRWDLGYDALGELTALNSTLTATNTPEESRTWQYDAAGNMISNTSAPQGQAARLELRTHVGRNQLVGVGGTGSTVVEGLVDKPSTVKVNGQPATVVSQGANGPWRFQKQVDFPLGSTTLTIQATDGNGNVGQKSYTVTVGNDETRTLVYDTNGNLKTKTYLSSGAAYRRESYTWDAENHLLGWENRLLVAGQPERVLASTTWVYDGLGRRVKEHNVQGTVTSDKNIVWDGLEMVQWQNADGTAQKNLFGAGEQTIATGETLLYITDHLGSVRGWQRLSDGAQGEADYSAYGQRTITSNATGVVPAKSFTGHYQHEASGMILAWARPYDVDLGRWICEDPLGESGGMNLYGYVGGGVTGAVDLLGLKDAAGPWTVGWEWLTGSGPRTHSFTDGDAFTVMLQNHNHIQDVRNKITNNLAGGGPLSGRDDYTLGGLQGVPKYISDYSTLGTGGLTGNLAVTYLGSYGLSYNITEVDPCDKTATIEFKVWNSSTIESATHPPLIGYMPWWSNNIGQPLNRFFSTGPLSKTTQTFNWTEKISYK